MKPGPAAAALTVQAHPFRELLRRSWSAFSRTVMGDIVATAVAITGVAVLFLAGSYAIIALTRLGAAVMRLLGG